MTQASPVKTFIPQTEMRPPSKNFVPQTSKFVKKALNTSGWKFRCEDVELETDEIANQDGLLPLVMWIAGEALEKLWGRQELVFRCDSKALCGVVPEFNRSILPESVWLHAIHYELEKAATSPDVSAAINDWFARWNNALSQKTILLLPPAPSPASTNRQS